MSRAQCGCAAAEWPVITAAPCSNAGRCRPNETWTWTCSSGPFGELEYARAHWLISRPLTPFNYGQQQWSYHNLGVDVIIPLKENVDFCILIVVELVSRQTLALPLCRNGTSVCRRKLFILTLEGFECVFLYCFSLFLFEINYGWPLHPWLIDLLLMRALSTKLNLVYKLHSVSWSADRWDGSSHSKIPIGSVEMQAAKEGDQDEERQKRAFLRLQSLARHKSICDTGSLMEQHLG